MLEARARESARPPAPSAPLLAAFVVGAITLGVMNIVEPKSVLGVAGDVGERVAYRHDQPTKSGDVFLGIGEYIEIPNPSP